MGTIHTPNKTERDLFFGFVDMAPYCLSSFVQNPSDVITRLLIYYRENDTSKKCIATNPVDMKSGRTLNSPCKCDSLHLACLARQSRMSVHVVVLVCLKF